MQPAAVVQLLTVAGLVALMLSIGFKVQLADILAAVRQPRLVLSAVLANFVLVPAATLGLLRLFDPEPLVAAGFVILAVCPGAPVGPAFAALARGDVPSATAQMVLLAGLSAFASPMLVLTLLHDMHLSGNLQIDSAAIMLNLIAGQLLPLLLGLALHHLRPHLAGRLARPLGVLANLLLVGVVALVLFRESETLAVIRWRGWMGMLLLLFTSLVIGWLCGGPDRPSRRSLAVTTSVRNAAAGLMIVMTNFAGTPAATAVVAYSLASIFGTLGIALVVGRRSAAPLQAAA